MTSVLLVPCKVQGDDAPESIVRAFGRLERWIAAAARDGRVDDLPQLTILARGGGSLEDLWSFNDERVVRAVVGHSLPVVCGVGHEVDVTLADFAADVRAATPSAAAELVVPDRADWMAAFRRAGERTAAAVGRTLEATRRELAAERRALDRLDPRAQLAADRERVGLLLDRAVRVADGAIVRRRAGLEVGRGGGTAAAARPACAPPDRPWRPRASALAVLDPQATLERGYAIVRRAVDERILRAPGRRAGRDGPGDPAGGRRAARDGGRADDRPRPRRRDRDRRPGLGLGIGMLISGRITRWMERDEEQDDG